MLHAGLNEKARKFSSSCTAWVCRGVEQHVNVQFERLTELNDLTRENSTGSNELQLRPTESHQVVPRFIGIRESAQLDPDQYERVAENIRATYAVCAAVTAVRDQQSRVADTGRTRLATAVAALTAAIVQFGEDSFAAQHRVEVIRELARRLDGAAAIIRSPQSASKGTQTRLEAVGAILSFMLKSQPMTAGAASSSDERHIVARETGSLERDVLARLLCDAFTRIDDDDNGFITRDEGWKWLEDTVDIYKPYSDAQQDDTNQNYSGQCTT